MEELMKLGRITVFYVSSKEIRRRRTLPEVCILIAVSVNKWSYIGIRDLSVDCTTGRFSRKE